MESSRGKPQYKPTQWIKTLRDLDQEAGEQFQIKRSGDYSSGERARIWSAFSAAMGSPSDLGTQQDITAEYFGLHASGRDDTTGSAPKAIERRDTTKNHMSIAFDDGINQHAIPRHWALKELREKHRLPCYSMRKPRGVGFDWPDDPEDPSATR